MSLSELLNAPPFGCDGGCSSTVPRTVFEHGPGTGSPLPPVQPSVMPSTTIVAELRARRSAIPDGAGDVVRSMIRNRNSSKGSPVELESRRRSSSVPNVELFAGFEVKSRTRFGGLVADTFRSNKESLASPGNDPGPLKFCGPGEPRRCPAPADIRFVATKKKSVALLLVSIGKPPDGHGPKAVIDPCLPQVSRTNEYSIEKGVRAG